MPDLVHYEIITVAEPPPPVQFGIDKLISAKYADPETGEVLIDTTSAPVSVVELLSNCTAEDLAAVVETWGFAWLLKQRGIGVNG